MSKEQAWKEYQSQFTDWLDGGPDISESDFKAGYEAGYAAGQSEAIDRLAASFLENCYGWSSDQCIREARRIITCQYVTESKGK